MLTRLRVLAIAPLLWSVILRRSWWLAVCLDTVFQVQKKACRLCYSYWDSIKRFRHLYAIQQLWQAHLCYSMPSCCCYACLTFHCSDPEEFLCTFFEGSGWNVQHIFPSPPSNQVSSILKPTTTNISCYTFDTWQHLVEKGFSLSSGLWNHGSPHPSWTVDMQSMYSQFCEHNMWQETSQTDGHVLTRSPWFAGGLWLNALSFHHTRLPPMIVLEGFFCLDVALTLQAA